MLQKLDVQTKRLLALADNIEHSDKFDMRSWCDCIAGHAVRLFLDARYVIDTRAAATAALGLTHHQAVNLFQPRDGNSTSVRDLTREEAAKAVRHLALTGEVVFS